MNPIVLATLLHLSLLIPNDRNIQKFHQAEPVLISHPIKIPGVNTMANGTTNLLLVPENRRSSKSRNIPIHFYHLPSKIVSNKPPVLYLPGGPGGSYDLRDLMLSKDGNEKSDLRRELEIYHEYRDIIIVNQRGHSFAPGFSIPNFEYSFQRGSDDEPFSSSMQASRQRDSFLKCIKNFEKMGVDVSGYDFMNIIDDLEDIRKYYDYPQIALVGTSFGSQWALGYIHKYPNFIDRAILSGVEPLDHAWDDPREIWKVYQLLDQAAQDSGMTSGEISLTQMVKEITERLDTNPVSFHLLVPEKNIDKEVIIGVDDFKNALMCPYAEDRVEALELWPKYITEMYHGDFSLIAHRSMRGRDGTSWSLMINHLIDNSIDISPEREKLISSREELAWLRDPSINYQHTRQVNPTPRISEFFRKPVKDDIPILMIHGNMDWNTPIENAHYVNEHYLSTKVITVNNGTHSAKRELIQSDFSSAKEILEFMNREFKSSTSAEYFSGLPDKIDLGPINFDPIESPSILYEALGLN